MEVGWIRRRSAVSEPVELMGWMDSTVQPWPRGSSTKEEGRDGGDEEEGPSSTFLLEGLK